MFIEWRVTDWYRMRINVRLNSFYKYKIYPNWTHQPKNHHTAIA